MPRDSAITTYADVNADEYRRDAAIDKRPMPLPAFTVFYGAPSDAARELLSRCRAAAGLTMNSRHSADDRDDVVATMAARWLAATEHTGRTGRPADVLRYIDRQMRRGAVARDSYRLPTMSQLCGEARNAFRAIDRHRKHLDAKRIEDAAALIAVRPMADKQRADEIIADRADLAAEHASKLARSLDRIKGARVIDGAVWSALYSIVRNGATDAVLGAERGKSAGAFKQQRDKGAQIIRTAYPASELLRALGIGRMVAHHGAAQMTPSKQLVGAAHLVGGEDFTREASHHLSKDVAEWWQVGMGTAPIESDPEIIRVIGPTVRRADRTPEQRADAFRWIRSSYAARMRMVGQVAPDRIQAASSAATKTSSATSILGAAGAVAWDAID